LSAAYSPDAGACRDEAFPVRVAYVIDNTLGRDDNLDFHKCDYVAQGFISDLPDEQQPQAAQS
jgi:hypothetical protein